MVAGSPYKDKEAGVTVGREGQVVVVGGVFA